MPALPQGSARTSLIRRAKSAVIVGTGYIGLEMADALAYRGIHVTLASRTEAILATVDTVFGKLVEAELQRHGVDVWNQVEVTSIEPVAFAVRQSVESAR
jgi:pyruvate/2-oxoglutarate dehydrogenase complex dihydrolipoamide dehydrogenase (E3) component